MGLLRAGDFITIIKEKRGNQVYAYERVWNSVTKKYDKKYLGNVKNMPVSVYNDEGDKKQVAEFWNSVLDKAKIDELIVEDAVYIIDFLGKKIIDDFYSDDSKKDLEQFLNLLIAYFIDVGMDEDLVERIYNKKLSEVKIRGSNGVYFPVEEVKK